MVGVNPNFGCSRSCLGRQESSSEVLFLVLSRTEATCKSSIMSD